MSLKQTIKQYVNRYSFIAIWVSRGYALIMSIQALRYSLLPKLRCFVSWSVKVTGWRNLELGNNVVISAGTWLNINNRIKNTKTLTIKANSFIGRDNFFTVGNSICIREYCLTASECAFIGSSHVIDDPLKPYLTTGTDLKNSIYVGANCFFGYRSSVIGNVKIGHGCIIGACTMVLGDIPPFSMVVGNPARIIKHYSFEQNAWIAGERTQGSYPEEEEYLLFLKRSAGFIVQPISVAVAIGGDI